MIKVVRIGPSTLLREESWSADLFCSDATLIFRGNYNVIELKKLGDCIEGWRVSTNEGTKEYDRRIESTPIYRQVNLKELSFDLDHQHWNSPVIEKKYCVQPGDVVINKILPLRASIATFRLPRHPVDGNCILIRGIKEPLNTWLAICLNQKPYEAYLLQRQGMSILARVGLKVLSQLYLPIPPMEDARILHHEIWDWNEQVLDNDQLRVRLIDEVESYVAQKLKETEVNFDDRPLNPGQFFPGKTIADSLVPNHVRLSYQLARLKQESGWISLSVLLDKKIATSRLSKSPEIGRYLRVRDIDRDLTFSLPEAESDWRSPYRVFNRPLTKGEVLISTFVTPSRVVFMDEMPSDQVYVTDSWERLRFRETPAAWALVLNTKVIRKQLAGMTIGSVQQYIRPENIPRLVVPDIDLDVRISWEEKLLRHHRKHRDLQQQRKLIDLEAQELFDRVHGVTKTK
ncbi:MAG: hypothetical protein QNJ55_16725 [Xenococcus sp. MO_188.B8]|nr:hypothetical protein [Xenococcus sp. MO_188.B8]